MIALKNSLHLPILLIALLLSGCQRYVAPGGRSHWQLFPAKDKISASDIDTGRYVIRPFDSEAFSKKVSRKDGKKIIEILEAADVKKLAEQGARFRLYFWNPTCVQTHKTIRYLDSLARTGEQVMIVSLRRDYDVIDRKLGKTAFSNYPYYLIGGMDESKVLTVRHIRFIRKACEDCYRQHRDNLAVADYLIVENGKVVPVL
jgi:hypothetical protein